MPKRRGNGDGMIRKRKDGRWEARFSFLDSFGRLHTKSFYGKQRNIVAAKMQEAQYALRNLDNHQEDCYKNLKLNEWIIFWLATFKKSKIEFSTLNSYSGTFVNHIQNSIGLLNINKVRPIDIQLLINSIDISQSTRTVELIMSILKDAYKTANVFGYTKNNPTLNIKLPKKKKQSSQALNKVQEEVYKKNLNSLDLMDRILLYLPLCTGISPSEMLAIRWENIDLNKNYVTINSAYKLGLNENEIGTTKNEYRKRNVPINDKLKALLNEVEDKTGFLFKGKNKEKPLNLNYPTKRFKEYVESINLAQFSLYDLRHTFATRLAENNVPKVVAVKLMGHSNSKMLDRVYEHANDDFTLEQIKKINKLF